jgi:spermidine/putrescine transport system permease protein
MLTRPTVSGALLVAPILFILVVLLALPVATLLLYAFWTQDYLTIDRTFTFANFLILFGDSSFWWILGRSLWVAGISTVLVLLISYPLAYYIVFHAKARPFLVLIILTLPFWMSFLLRILAWRLILGYNGVINYGLVTTGIVDEPLDWLIYSNTAVIITLVHSWVSFAILPIYVSLQKLDVTLIDASRDLGEGAATTFFRVTFPLTARSTALAGVLVFVPSMVDFGTPALIGSPQGPMLGSIIQDYFSRGNNWPLGAAVTTVSALVIVSFLSTLWFAMSLFARRWIK